MVGKKNQPSQSDAPSLPADAQPAGSGAVPGTAQSADQTFGERMKENAVGEQVSPGVNDGTMAPELAETADDQALAEEAGEPMVEYTGEFSRREISAGEWQAAGVSDMPTVVWERRTGNKVAKSVFTEQALQVLRQDGGFRVP